jgi:hypothetical protein
MLGLQFLAPEFTPDFFSVCLSVLCVCCVGVFEDLVCVFECVVYMERRGVIRYLWRGLYVKRVMFLFIFKRYM